MGVGGEVRQLFIFLFLFLFERAGSGTSRNSRCLTMFIRLRLSSASCFTRLIRHGQFLASRVFRNIVQGRSVDQNVFTFNGLLARLLRKIRRYFVRKDKFSQASQAMFMTTFLNQRNGVFSLLMGNRSHLLLTRGSFASW